MSASRRILQGLRWAATLYLTYSAVDDALHYPDVWDRAAILTGYAAMVMGLWWLPGSVVVFGGGVVLAVVAEHYAILVLGAPLLAVLCAAHNYVRATSSVLLMTVVAAVAGNVPAMQRPWLPWLILPLSLGAAAIGAVVGALRSRQERIDSAVAAVAQVGEMAAAIERRELATRLHDDIGSALASASLMAAQGETHPDPEVAVAFGDIRQACARGARDLGQVVALLRKEPSAPRSSAVSLAHRARELADTLRASGWQVDLSWHEDVDRLPVALRKLIERFLVEAVTNVLKHAARGGRVQMGSQCAGSGFAVTVTNDRRPAGTRAEFGAGTGLNALVAAANDLDTAVTWSHTPTEWTLRLDGDFDDIFGPGTFLLPSP